MLIHSASLILPLVLPLVTSKFSLEGNSVRPIKGYDLSAVISFALLKQRYGCRRAR